MLFSSPIFLYLFLPLVLLGYYLSFRGLKNYVLLFASLVFFAWGGVSYTIILIGSIVLNYLFGLLIDRQRGRPLARTLLIGGVASNILLLAIFKYANFITLNLNELFTWMSLPPVPVSHILLPVGISFYTFHALSYLVDIYRQKTRAQTNIFDLALYICMFSQLIAGPIIRYSDVWLQLRGRDHSITKFASGIERFVIGLGKKVLIANILGKVADNLFGHNPSELGALNAWLGIICYTFQIYCDFAGYSDMAIGLGRMFGFEFLENFNFPYLATSVKDFWRRWHISLSSFFRDYVYIPLGGNRVSTKRVYINLLLVFFLTGFWHGANWTFVVWGLVHGFFMVLERLGFENILQKTWKPFSLLYTLLVVMFAWVLFRAEDFTLAISYWQAMFDFEIKPVQQDLFYNLVNHEVVTALLIAIAGSYGLFAFFSEKLQKMQLFSDAFSRSLTPLYHLFSMAFYAGIIILSTMYLIAGTYNPFIYYQF
jgi:alginate O-acetyltransferase complex protein AlgI